VGRSEGLGFPPRQLLGQQPDELPVLVVLGLGLNNAPPCSVSNA
jgi:hypothetical protein